MNLTLSMAQGATDVPLIEQTIGDFFDDMAARQGDHEALVSAPREASATATANCSAKSTGSPAPCWRSGWSRATASASGRTTTRPGC